MYKKSLPSSLFEVLMPSPRFRIRKMTLARALDKYLKTVSVHKKDTFRSFIERMSSDATPSHSGSWTKSPPWTSPHIAICDSLKSTRGQEKPSQEIPSVSSLPCSRRCTTSPGSNGEHAAITPLNWCVSPVSLRGANDV